MGQYILLKGDFEHHPIPLLPGQQKNDVRQTHKNKTLLNRIHAALTEEAEIKGKVIDSLHIYFLPYGRDIKKRIRTKRALRNSNLDIVLP